MARLPEITERDAVDAEARGAFDAIVGTRGGRIVGPYAMLLHSPEAGRRVAALGDYLRLDGVLTPRQREVAILAVARAFDCAFEWAAHEPTARAAGLPKATITTIGRGEAPDALAPEDAAIVRFVRELLDTRRVAPETFDALRTHLGDRGVIEMATHIGLYVLFACVLSATDLQPEAAAPRLPEGRAR